MIEIEVKINAYTLQTFIRGGRTSLIFTGRGLKEGVPDSTGKKIYEIHRKIIDGEIWTAKV